MYMNMYMYIQHEMCTDKQILGVYYNVHVHVHTYMYMYTMYMYIIHVHVCHVHVHVQASTYCSTLHVRVVTFVGSC